MDDPKDTSSDPYDLPIAHYLTGERDEPLPNGTKHRPMTMADFRRAPRAPRLTPKDRDLLFALIDIEQSSDDPYEVELACELGCRILAKHIAPHRLRLVGGQG